LEMAHPWSVVASFDTALVVSTVGPRPAGVMGTPYNDVLSASGGSGIFTWTVLTGSPPPGVQLATSGQVTGVPSQTGLFGFTARVNSGLQTKTFVDTITVTAPTLVKASVVAQILTGSSSLTTADLTYLDLIGNNNSTFDVGDFLAWVLATGATPAPADATAVAGPRSLLPARRSGGRQ